MNDDTGARPRPRLGGAAGGALISVLGLLAALAIVYTNADGVGRVADDAAAQQQAEAALGALAAARVTLGQVLLVDPAQVETIAAVTAEASALLGELEARLVTFETALGDGGDQAAALRQTAQVAAGDYLSLAGAGDLAGAADLASARLGPALDDLSAFTAAERDRRAAAIAAARAEVGRLATASRFMVALGIPGAALLGWLLFARRRRRRIALTQALEREREISRSKDQLIANISHELRTPLTGIYAAARAMEESGLSDAHLAGELTEIIVDQSADLTRMIDDLLVSARADAGRLRFDIDRVAVAAEARAVVAEFRRSGKQIGLDCTPALVLADPLRLRQALRNLVSNAVRHGGDHIAVVGRPAGDAFELAVFDDGPGVCDEIAGRLFTRFVHTDDRPLITGSVGLGLAITRLLAEGMGGTVAYTRSDGRSRFSVRVPAAPPAASALAGTDQPMRASTPAGHGSREPMRS